MDITNYILSSPDMVTSILEYLNDPKDLCRARQINKLFNQIVLKMDYYNLCIKSYIINYKWSILLTAATLGNLKLLKYKLDQSDSIPIEAESIFTTACLDGQLRIMEWMTKKYGPNLQIVNTSSIFINTCNNDKIMAAKWLYEYNNLEQNDNFTANILPEIFKSVCAKGYLKLAQWLMEVSINCGNKIITNDNVYDSLCRSIENNKLHMTKWLLSSSHDTIFNVNKLLERACSKSNIAMIELIYNYAKNIKYNIDISAENYKMFKAACGNSNLAALQWLSTVGGFPPTLQQDNDKYLYYILSADYVDDIQCIITAKWFLDYCNIINKPVDLQNNKEKIFKKLFKHTYRNVWEWFYTYCNVIKQPINLTQKIGNTLFDHCIFQYHHQTKSSIYRMIFLINLLLLNDIKFNFIRSDDELIHLAYSRGDIKIVNLLLTCYVKEGMISAPKYELI